MDAAILSGLVAIIVALIGLIGVMWRRNGKVVHNPPNPDITKGGDISATYWISHFDRIFDKLDSIEGLLRDRLPRG